MHQTSGFAEVNGARLYYEMAGKGHPLVLNHAGIADCRMWDDQFAAFAARFTVIRWDARGYGRSAEPPGLYSLHDDLSGLLRHLGVDQAHVVSDIAARLQASIAGARKVVIPDVAHMVNMEEPEVFNRIVLEFLEGVDK